ncbi:cellulose synthase/poly-beta-1,6-N-acetylglucosamine synthase-like glycosyltransferase [Flavobacterium nitrogenifigens]|uniref:Cellulose synthase/poly-beta-1,6-N-acetylglucosamine synthase-like glycosyltransferase n=2 Tax=Flavobacterium TaxID=237 RepID=A0A7W7IYD3_9FLAO|nr:MULTISPECIES: glycosyltransferase [Flavobacterium]MBB4802735.1 cellulose synthase/poly-beta-1,6-N-acetylglucosamine synthase-like glycosyltransferase [Flavobacterium nitrogenifigens]MBB6387693.1 cellulose synthase/poly-beta-1,6-N-acetylglucosamine synthase-like glycosyltransferase [Flavobacterium notoginsengisoli]
MTFFNTDITWFLDVYILLILGYAILIMSSYLILAYLSQKELRGYLKKNSFVDYEVLLTSEFAPKLSLIAPAYNEGFTIEENVKSLLSLNYNNYQVIVVNDGSKDNSMEILVKTYDLVLTDLDIHPKIETKKIKGIYTSRNAAFKKLIVVDKENGGKADALNVGLNIAQNPYVVCIDVDCILDKDSLLKLAKPFLESQGKRIIATGGVVRIANQCIIKNGRLVEVNIPDVMLPRIQVLEYLRAFLLGRMAWGRLDGLLLISGAFGAFDKEIAILAGGYSTKTVGEDMELIVRMRRYMLENKLPYAVSYIPDPLCWTEAPEDFKIFKKQRSRWMRGTIETLSFHKRMFLNPKYKLLGMLSVPYWTLFEFLAPGIEFIGLVITFIFIIFGLLNWHFFFLLLLFVYSFAVFFSVIALFSEERTYHKYPKQADFFKLLMAAFIEPIYFHPLTVYSALIGYKEKIMGTKGWGEMTRKGFTKK